MTEKGKDAKKKFTKEQRLIYKLGFLNGQESKQQIINNLRININKLRRIIAYMAEALKEADRIDKILRKDRYN